MKLTKKPILIISFSLALIIAGGIALLGFAHAESDKRAPDAVETDSTAVAPVRKEFGLPVDSFVIIEDKIKPNEFLANILGPHEVSAQTLANLTAKSRDIFDIRKLRAGDHYTLFCTKDSSRKACYFVYQPDPIQYIVYDLQDSLNIYAGSHEVTTEEKEIGGTINSSLFATLDNLQADPDLAMKMAKIYAWDIDFYSIRKGDRFKLIYEEQYVKDRRVGTGRIKAAVFVHDGNPYYAFYYHNDSTDTDGYYNEKAQSLQKAFLKAPLKFFRITSHYSMRRFHPVQHRMKAHLGTDYAAPAGTPIMATAAGVVIASQYTQFNGNYVKIRHNGTYTTQYLHMSKRAVRNGQHVNQGQVIGYVGSTGLATGPHVCYRFWKNGRQVDPLRQKFPPAEPISPDDSPYFNRLVEKEMARLEAVQTGAGTELASLQ